MEISFNLARILARSATASVLLEAPKLDAIGGIVNMSQSLP